MRRVFLVSAYTFLVLLLVQSTGTGALAYEGTTSDYTVEIGTKLGRGLVNILSSPADWPCTVASDMKEQGGTGFFSGFGKGIAFMLRRILVGVTEVGTFMIPAPETLPPVCHEQTWALQGPSYS